MFPLDNKSKMAKTVGLILAIWFLTHAHAHAHQVFNVEGDVYCDPCRVQFVTDLSKKLPGGYSFFFTDLYK